VTLAMRRASGPASGLALAAALAVAAAFPVAAAAEAERRSGTVVAVDRAAGTVVVEEIGSGRGSEGNEVARHRIVLEPTTPVVRITRAAGPAPDGWVGGFVQTQLGREALREGAFVTVTLRREDGQLTAEQVTVVTPGGSGPR
jgi:ABC-type sugar transport system substrate-binding protein